VLPVILPAASKWGGRKAKAKGKGKKPPGGGRKPPGGGRKPPGGGRKPPGGGRGRGGGGGGGRGAIGAAVRSPNRFFSMCTHASNIARLHASMLAPHPLVFILLIILIKMRVIIFLCSNESERTIVNATD
jgi:hypothetical protein